jgi:hypothetical protein
MRRAGAIASALVALALIPATASATDPPPGAQMSSNLEYVKWIQNTKRVVEGKFDKNLLILTGRFGFKTIDVSDPANPKALDSFIPADLADGGWWQNEDMEIDTTRKLIIGSLDPRHTDNPLGGCPPGGSVRIPACKSGFYVISYADPANLRQVGDFVDLPAGHTSSCIQGCKYLWTGGPARRDDQADFGPFTPGGRGDGRPIWVTDLRDARHPRVSDQPIDLWRNDGLTDYSHDVDEDANGIAWVSGRGGIRGYATSGRYRDPYQDRVRNATPTNPILVAGGGVGGTAQPVMFMHNSGRPTNGSVTASGVTPGNILFGTEEDFTRPCEASGKIIASDLTDSWGGEPAQNSTPEAPYRMEALDSFHPFLDTPETADPSLECSAHYFEIQGQTMATAWYGQGLRLLDIHDARDLRQVGYYRVNTPAGGDPAVDPPSSSWDTAFKGDLVYLFDMNRGVEVLRIKQGTDAAANMRAVTAPSLHDVQFASRPVGGLASTGTGYVCPLLTTY